MPFRVRRNAALLLLPLLLAGCAPEDSSSSPAPTAPAASAMPSATPSREPAAAPAIPADCRDVVDAEAYAAAFADVPLNDPQLVDGRPVERVQPGDLHAWLNEDADLLAESGELFCIWGEPGADVTALTLAIGSPDPAVTASFLDARAQAGFTCEPRDQGQECEEVTHLQSYDVDASTTYFARDGILVMVYQANFPTENLMGAIIDRIWSAA
ncbi:hypothetical protein [Naasia aerilata]|uniref:DUF3558 domain-containing protein n=1 Tax=Naasia aerilata TaxID=1162966 RepID=A0ABN6XQW3_9MICO|nr:hypothetical protein [Naasia aerilata]BDZ46025.1 hypothetical protein GCM10025866_19340 [Naasia aerilata]